MVCLAWKAPYLNDENICHVGAKICRVRLDSVAQNNPGADFIKPFRPKFTDKAYIIRLTLSLQS
jgi:hypothetical protein